VGTEIGLLRRFFLEEMVLKDTKEMLNCIKCIKSQGNIEKSSTNLLIAI